MTVTVFGVWLFFSSPSPDAASQATTEPKGEHRHAQGHGHVAYVNGGQKGQPHRDAQPVRSYVSVIDVGLLALGTLPDHGVTREVDVGTTVVAHVVVAIGTDDVVASGIPFDRNTAVAAGLAGLANDRFGFPQVLAFLFAFSSGSRVHCCGGVRGGGGGGGCGVVVGISVDPAKYVVAHRTFQTIGMGSARATDLVRPIRRDKLAATRTRCQRRIFQHLLKALEFDPVLVEIVITPADYGVRGRTDLDIAVVFRLRQNLSV